MNAPVLPVQDVSPRANRSSGDADTWGGGGWLTTGYVGTARARARGHAERIGERIRSIPAGNDQPYETSTIGFVPQNVHVLASSIAPSAR